MYGERATPYQVLSDLADRMASTFSLDDVQSTVGQLEMADTVAGVAAGGR